MRRPKRCTICLTLLLACAAALPAADGGPVWPAPPADPVLRLESVLSSLAKFEIAVQGPIEIKPRRIQKLRRPSGVAVDARGRVWVSDARQRALLLVDPDLGVALIYGSGTKPRLREPRGVALGADGTVYVADSELRGVVAFDGRGEVTEVYGEGWLDEPIDVALSPDGARLYVADAGANNVAVFDLASGDKIDTLGRRGKGIGEFYLPMAVEFDSAGNLLVVDQLNGRVQIFDAGGSFVRALEVPGRTGLTRPSDVAADGAGRLYVTDSAESRLRVYDSDLDALLAVGRNGLGDGEFLGIGGIAAGTDRLAVLDEAGGRVQLFRLYGAGAPPTPRPEPGAGAGASSAAPAEPPPPTPPAAAEPAPASPTEPIVEPSEVVVEEPSAPPPDMAAASESPVDDTATAQRLSELVSAWAAAWAEQDVERYLGFYSRSFRPADGSSREAWSDLRRERISGPSSIQLDVEIVETRITSERAQVTFLQSYRSDRYTDRVRKTLELVREDGDWMIEQERVLETLD